MNPTIISIAGPLKGMVFVMVDQEVSIGRDSTNTLSIKDKSVSRRHCVIYREESLFKISDMNSHNGTFVNEVPVKERPLEHEDNIQIGSSYFIFLLADKTPSASSNEVQFDNGDLITKSTIRLHLEGTLSLMARDLGVLMKIGATINSIRNLKVLQRQLLESLFEVTPAQRGAILIAEDNLDDPVSAFSLNRVPDISRAVIVSRTVAQQVLAEGVAILCSDTLDASTFQTSKSLIESRIKSLLCIPLRRLNKVIGFIYLDTGEAAFHFNKSHLQMVTSIAGIAASAIENVRHIEWLQDENQRLQKDIKINHNMVGESAGMVRVYQLIAKIAPTDSTVLICGESGTGKELAAGAIHFNSPRANKPFVALNCATLTETLLESELFGHERGAFTGAIAQKKGKLELADGGTVFLDEVGELATALQAKLLRALQERAFERIGGTRPIKVDIRVIAATNKNLDEAVKQHTFRQDLYYRLNVISFAMPPLRERAEDIPLLANYFVAAYSKKCKRQVTGISPEAHACLLHYHWPGNVREFENAIERAIVLGNTARILPEDLPEAVLEAAPAVGKASASYYESVKQSKKALILKVLSQADGNFTEAARILGIHPNNLHRLVRNLQLKPMLEKRE